MFSQCCHWCVRVVSVPLVYCTVLYCTVLWSVYPWCTVAACHGWCQFTGWLPRHDWAPPLPSPARGDTASKHRSLAPCKLLWSLYPFTVVVFFVFVVRFALPENQIKMKMLNSREILHFTSEYLKSAWSNSRYSHSSWNVVYVHSTGPCYLLIISLSFSSHHFFCSQKTRVIQKPELQRKPGNGAPDL